ncbi:MAG: hypothetical protein HFF50_10515 [Lawsonibacter sp.]|nr:hypothetical protein [Lawsonibacter sp.]
MGGNRSYQCPKCGRELGYKGMCWQCQAAWRRQGMEGWTPEQIQAKRSELIAHVERLKEDAWDEDFWGLLSYHDGITPELQRAALAAEVDRPCELYYRAPADVRDGLIEALMGTESPMDASRLMCCLAMQGDDRSLEVFRDLEEHPRPWREELYVDPSVYAWTGGWTFDKTGVRRQLNFDVCYPLIKGDRTKDTAAQVFRIREDRCPSCGNRLVDILTLDGRDNRLKFLGLDGIITATCCPACVPWEEPAYSRFTLDGGSQAVLPYQYGSEYDPDDICYEVCAAYPYVLGPEPVPLFYGAHFDDVSTVGGFANWIEDANYYTCPDCGKTMKYLAQIQWDTLDFMEGTLYIEICPDCRVVSMHHQQT